MNSRTKRRFRSYGMSNEEILESQKNHKNELKNICRNATRIPGIFDQYCLTDEHHINIIKKAKHLYIVGKHAGSKPIYKLLKRIKSVEEQISKYTAAFKAIKNIQDKVEEPKNVD